MKIRNTHPAFPHPLRSLRRKMSEKTVMKIQIAMNQKKNANIDHRKSPNEKSAITLVPPFSQVSVDRRGTAASASPNPRLPSPAPRRTGPSHGEGPWAASD